MNNKGHIPHYNVTDDILNIAAMIAEKVNLLPVPVADSIPVEGGLHIPPTQFREKGAGVFAGEHLLGRAPLPQYIPGLMQEFEDWLEHATAHPLLKAGLTVYQYVMVQFFEGDNICYGMQRAQDILHMWRPRMQVVVLESALSREGLVRAFEQCELYGEAGPFLLYFLKSIYAVLETIPVEEISAKRAVAQASLTSVNQGDEKLRRLLDGMGAEEYTTRELMGIVGLKHRPTFRDKYLLPAMALGLVEMTIPDKPNSSQQRYRKRVPEH